MTKDEAMMNYIELYNKVTNNQHTSNEDEELDIHLDNITYSSTAKQAQKEINEFLENSSENEKLFHKLKDQIYKGDVITKDLLEKFCKDNNFDCKY
jgi:phage-related protein